MFFEFRGFKIHASLVFGAAAVACLAAYVSLRASLFGVAAFVFIIAAVATDFFSGSIGAAGAAGEGENKKRGSENGEGGGRNWRRLALEVGVTVAVAVAAWFALCFFLETNSPLNVVTSCSMLPALERGDFVVLRGGGVSAFEASVPFALGGAETAPVVLDARKQGKRYYLRYSTILGGSGVSFANYSFSDCVRVPLNSPFGSQPQASPQASNDSGLEACASGVTVNEAFFDAANSNDVIVYEANPSGYGLIIHRVLARLRATDGVYYLTKGDNNQFADQQLGITLVPESAVKGRVVGRIPFVGYFKLLLFMQFDFPAGCDSTLKRLN